MMWNGLAIAPPNCGQIWVSSLELRSFKLWNWSFAWDDFFQIGHTIMLMYLTAFQKRKLRACNMVSVKDELKPIFYSL